MKKILLSAVLLSSVMTFAQDGKLKVSGSVDAYVRSNINTSDKTLAPTSSFANENGFALGMANLITSYEGKKSGVVADLVFGPKAEQAVFNAAGTSSQTVNQLFAYYNVNDKLTLTMGRFNTFYGYEVISPVNNFNYSTSYLFTNGPFSHTGIKANYQATEDLSFLLAVLDPTDAKTANGDQYSIGGQVGYKGQFFNVEYGYQGSINDNTNSFIPTIGKTLRLDYTGGFDVTETFHVGINAAYNTAETATDIKSGFYGAALYLQNKINDQLSIGLRPELFSVFTEDKVEGDIFAATLSANYQLDNNLRIIPELRVDTSNDGLVSGPGNSNKLLSSFVLGAVYSF